MSKHVAIIQSNYIPWKGYFNIIKCVDEFVLLDDVQYTRRDWRNRNLIKTAQGLKWLTIPVQVKGDYYAKIKDVDAAGTQWRGEHWNQIEQTYKKSNHFALFAHQLKDAYLGSNEINLSKINLNFINVLCSMLKIDTPIRWSMEFETPQDKTERLVHICKSLQATDYISGPAAKDYLDIGLFLSNGINVKWIDYSGYNEYKQLYSGFEHGVSVIDLIFNEGTKAAQFLKDKLWD